MLESLTCNLQDALVLNPAFPLRHLAGLLGRSLYSVSIPGCGKVYMRPRTSDGVTFRKVFSKREYDLSVFPQYARIRDYYHSIISSGETPIIVDAGANVGAASLWFAKTFPEAYIIAIEPDPENASICRRNTHGLSNVRVIEGAIGSESGRVTLDRSDNKCDSIKTMRSDHGEVPVLTVADAVGTAGPLAKLFFVKIDIEGFENDLFSRNTEWVKDAQVITMEPHDWMLPGKGTSNNFLKAISEQNGELLISGENLVYVRR